MKQEGQNRGLFLADNSSLPEAKVIKKLHRITMIYEYTIAITQHFQLCNNLFVGISNCNSITILLDT